jgi:hypothetical protein
MSEERELMLERAHNAVAEAINAVPLGPDGWVYVLELCKTEVLMGRMRALYPEWWEHAH